MARADGLQAPIVGRPPLDATAGWRRDVGDRGDDRCPSAVWLTTPRETPGLIGASPGTTGTAAPFATPSTAGRTPVPTTAGAPAGTPLPQLVRNGELPSVTSVMVWSGLRYRLADLATGLLGPESIASDPGESVVLARPGGGWVCICTDWTQVSGARLMSSR